jgi:hypothetical protein
MTSIGRDRGQPVGYLIDVTWVKQQLNKINPETGRRYTQRAIADELGVTESGISAALKRDRERQGGTHSPYIRRLPWRIPTHLQGQYISRMLVLWEADKEGELDEDKRQHLEAFLYELSQPLGPQAPLGTVVYFEPRSQRWRRRARTTEDGPDPYVEGSLS